ICAAADHSASLVGITDQLGGFALWCSSSSSCTNPQHCRALGQWATWYYFVKHLGDASTAPSFRRLDPFLQRSAHWNKR
ncbi:hypothetical protein MTR67_012472, partial [Solanum verrucosum]